MPMSLDHDAGDRTFDRQMAYLGLLDDAAPIFRDGVRTSHRGRQPLYADNGIFVRRLPTPVPRFSSGATKLRRAIFVTPWTPQVRNRPLR